MSADASLPTTGRVRALARPRLRSRVPRGRSDDALVARVRAGDERAFELIFDRYHRGLLAFCRQMLAGTEEAEDALQHTFMAAYRALRASDRPIRLKAWLYTIARNRCLSILRARREQLALDDGHAASDGLAADVDRRAELRGLLADLEQLPEEQRAALVLFELGDHRHDEIAEVLGVRREKVKALVFQARESLAGWRRARETPCVEIREQLATARGAALKRATLRRHVARCAGCAEFEAEVRRQRAGMAALLPVVPTAGLKAAVLAAAGLGAGAGGGSLAGLGGAAKGVAAKTLLCAAVAGSAGSAGYVAVHEMQLHDGRGLLHATASHTSHRAGTGAARAAKPIATPRPAAPVIVTAAATTAPAKPRVAGGNRARHGRHGRHGKHAGWTRGSNRGRHGHGQRRGGSRRGHSRGGEQRGHANRSGPAQPGRTVDPNRSARRRDSTQRHGSANHPRSAQRHGSANHPRSAQRHGSAERAHSKGGGQATPSSFGGGSRPGTEG
jgi:RNA polymerase sigma factor (sigma-70 family)